jgi:hypothetical protein
MALWYLGGSESAVEQARKAAEAPDTDRRPSTELLDLIETKGREIAAALVVLRNLEALRT